MELLRAGHLAVPHGFPTRDGGVSAGAFATLNAGVSVGDDAAAVDENLRRLAVVAGATGPIRTLSQVHGTRVLETRADGDARGRPEADAHWTEDAGVSLGIATADCVPVLFEDPVGRRVAAAHAGWRGVEGEVVVRVLEALEARGSRAADLRVVLGPAIGACCFEVSDELAARFRDRFGPKVATVPPGRVRPHLDLALALRLSLMRCGVPAPGIQTLAACTACEPRFYSYRRDGGRTGRHLSFITCCFATPP